MADEFRFSDTTTTIESAVYEAIGAASAITIITPHENLADALLEVGTALVTFIQRQQLDTGKLNEAAVVMHEMFTSYVHAGFTEHQAMYLIGELAKTMMTNNQGDPE